MSIIALFRSSFFSDVVSLKYPVLTVIAAVCLIGCGLLQWHLCTHPKEGRFHQYYLAFALIIGIIIVDMAKILLGSANTLIIQNIFGCLVLGIIGMALAAGVWYLAKRGAQK